MKKILSRIAICFAVLLVLSMVISIPVVAKTKVTVVGEVNDEYQIVGRDGNVYEIANTVVGNELQNFIGAVVEVTGTVEEEEGNTVIYVESFKALDE